MATIATYMNNLSRLKAEGKLTLDLKNLTEENLLNITHDNIFASPAKLKEFLEEFKNALLEVQRIFRS